MKRSRVSKKILSKQNAANDADKKSAESTNVKTTTIKIRRRRRRKALDNQSEESSLAADGDVISSGTKKVKREGSKSNKGIFTLILYLLFNLGIENRETKKTGFINVF